MSKSKEIRFLTLILAWVVVVTFLISLPIMAQDLNCICKEKKKNGKEIVLECVCKPINVNQPGNNGPVAKGKRLIGGPLKRGQLLSNPAAAELKEDRPGAPWITRWYMPTATYINSRGFAVSGPVDHIKAASGGALTQESLSTVDGLIKTKTTKLNWGKNNGGTADWTVLEIDPQNGDNMSVAYGLLKQDLNCICKEKKKNGKEIVLECVCKPIQGQDFKDFDTWALLVIESPKDHVAVMSTAHDDWAQVWINGEKWYNNSKWTGGATTVSYDVEVKLNRGGNVLLFRCGESGGSDYFNLHFDDATDRKVKYYPNKANNKNDFFAEVSQALRGLAIEPVDKLPVTWSDIKRKQ